MLRLAGEAFRDGGENRFNDIGEGMENADRDGVRGLLESGELAVEQRGGHEVVFSRGEALADEFLRSFEINEAQRGESDGEPFPIRLA